MLKEKVSMFEYKTALAAVVDKGKMAVGERNGTYIFVCAVGPFYNVYDIEKLNIVERGPSISEIECIGILNRYIVTGSQDNKMRIYNKGSVIAEKKINGVPKEILCTESDIYVQIAEKILQIKIADINQIEKPDAVKNIKAKELVGIKSVQVHKMVRLGVSDKIGIIDTNGVLVIYCTSKQRQIYTVKAYSFIGATDAVSSMYPSILAISLKNEVVIVDVKKDIVLQKIPIEGVVSLDFRKDSLSTKELVAATREELIVVCLQKSAAKKRVECSGAQKIRFAGAEPFLAVCMQNELRILSCRSEQPVVCKKRVGVVFGDSVSASFFGKNLLVFTGGRMYSISLRKDTQTKEITQINTEGATLPLSVSGKVVLAACKRSIEVLEETVGGLAVRRRKIAHISSREYIMCAVSFCGRTSVFAVRREKEVMSILIASTESGFFLGQIDVLHAPETLLTMSVNTLHRVVTVVYKCGIVEYAYTGKEVKQIKIAPAIKACIVDTKTEKFFALATAEEIYVMSKEGSILRKCKKSNGVLLSIRATEDRRWIYALSTEKDSSFIDILDMETGHLLSSINLPFFSRDCLISPDRLSLIILSEKQVLLYSNTSIFFSPPVEPTEGICTGITLASKHRSRVRILLDYEQIKEKVNEKRDKLLPFGIEAQENMPACATVQKDKEIDGLINDSKEQVQDLVLSMLSDNYPISSIIESIQQTDMPDLLFSSLVDKLESYYDIADALLNRLIHYRRKDLSLANLQIYSEKRKRISERLVTLYLSALSLSR